MEVSSIFPIDSLVQVIGGNNKKMNGMIGQVRDVVGNFVVVDFENLRDLKYIYYQDLSLIDTSMP